MKNAIWKKFLFFAVIPFLVVFVLLSFIIVKAVYQDKISQAAMDVRALSMYNETNLREHLDSVRVSLLTAISELEKIGLDNPNARRRGQNIVISMMENRYIYNAWLAYEPMAFDGRDPDFPSDYPGAPSGRYIRSFVRVGDEYVVTPEMDENSIDDPARSPWYTIPKETDKAAVDLVKSPMYDYRLGDGYKNSLCISMPIHRDGKVIGVVGADILLNQTLLGLEVSQGAISALFNDKYQVISAPDIGDVGKFIDDLGFTSPDEIKSALDGASDRFLRVGHSPFINARAYTYIKPMRIDGLDGLLYLYEAIPEDAVNKALSNVLMPIAASLLTAILLFLALLFYISHTISKPIQRLTAAADAISRGDLDMEIAPSNSNDEMSVLTRSLHRLVEQLRVYITLLERSGKLLDLYTRLNEAAYHNADIKDTFDTMARDICAFFGVSAASLVFTADGVPSLLSSFDASRGFSPQPKLFAHHDAVSRLLAGNKYVFLNSHGMAEQGVLFAAKDTTSVCILPISVGDELRGYFILEGKDSGVFVSDDEHLVFISKTVSYILSQKEARIQGPVSPNPPDEPGKLSPGSPEETESTGDLPLVAAARGIDGLDVDRGLALSGDSQENYLRLLRISAACLESNIKRAGELLESGNLRDFAIEVHGMKGALYNIGANAPGDMAFDLETDGKGGDYERCLSKFPSFTALISSFLTLLRRALADDGTKTEGRVEELASALPRARDACAKFNMFAALDIITPLAKFTYDPDIDAVLRKIEDMMHAMEYDDAINSISELTGMLERD